MSYTFPVETSARHVHLTAEDFATLFGAAEEPETRAVFELGKLARKAFNRIKDRNYEALYEGEGFDVQNLYAEAYCEGFEAGLKAAGVIIREAEGGEDGK